MPDHSERTTSSSAAGPILRVGRKVKRTIYVQRGPEPTDADPIVGLMDDGTLAAAVVVAFNRQSANDRTYWLHPRCKQHIPMMLRGLARPLRAASQQPAHNNAPEAGS